MVSLKKQFSYVFRRLFQCCSSAHGASLLWDGVVYDLAIGPDGCVPSSTTQVLYCVGFHACEPGIWSASREWCWLTLGRQERQTSAWHRSLLLWRKPLDLFKGRGLVQEPCLLVANWYFKEECHYSAFGIDLFGYWNGHPEAAVDRWALGSKSPCHCVDTYISYLLPLWTVVSSCAHHPKIRMTDR